MCLNQEFEEIKNCEIGLKLISHLPLEMQKDFKNAKMSFNQMLMDIEVRDHQIRCMYPDM